MLRWFMSNSRTNKIAIIGVLSAVMLGIIQSVIGIIPILISKHDASEAVWRPRLAIVDAHIDTSDGAEKLSTYFTNAGELPAVDSSIHVIGVKNNGDMYYIDNYVSPGEIAKSQAKLGHGMPISMEAASLIFCFRYGGEGGRQFQHWAFYQVDRQSPSVGGRIQLKSGIEPKRTRELAERGCKLVPTLG